RVPRCRSHADVRLAEKLSAGCADFFRLAHAHGRGGGTGYRRSGIEAPAARGHAAALAWPVGQAGERVAGPRPPVQRRVHSQRAAPAAALKEPGLTWTIHEPPTASEDFSVNSRPYSGWRPQHNDSYASGANLPCGSI